MLILVKPSWSLLSKFFYSKLAELGHTQPSTQTNGPSLQPAASGESESHYFFFFLIKPLWKVLSGSLYNFYSLTYLKLASKTQSQHKETRTAVFLLQKTPFSMFSPALASLLLPPSFELYILCSLMYIHHYHLQSSQNTQLIYYCQLLAVVVINNLHLIKSFYQNWFSWSTFIFPRKGIKINLFSLGLYYWVNTARNKKDKHVRETPKRR